MLKQVKIILIDENDKEVISGKINPETIKDMKQNHDLSMLDEVYDMLLKKFNNK